MERLTGAIAAAYIYMIPRHGRDTFGVVHTDGGVYLPEWWRDRAKLGIRTIALAGDDLERPLVELVAKYARELLQGDGRQAPARRDQGGDSGEA